MEHGAKRSGVFLEPVRAIDVQAHVDAIGKLKRRVAESYAMYPAVAIPPSHSRTYRSLVPVREAKSALVTGPLAASSLKEPQTVADSSQQGDKRGTRVAEHFTDELINLRLVQNGLGLHVTPSFTLKRWRLTYSR